MFYNLGGGRENIQKHIEYMWKVEISHLGDRAVQDVVAWSKSG